MQNTSCHVGGRPGQARRGSALAVVHLNGGGEHVHIQAAVVTDGNAGQGVAILEGAGLDVAHALGDGDIGEGSAAVEGTGLDVLHAVSDVHGGQVGAALEGDGTDAGDSAFHFHIGDLVGLVCPGCRAVGGKVGHTAGAADGQGAVGQGPGHVLAAGVVAGGSSGCSGGSGTGSSRRCAAAAAGQGDGGDQDGSGSAAQTDFALEFHDEVSSFLFLVYYLL